MLMIAQMKLTNTHHYPDFLFLLALLLILERMRMCLSAWKALELKCSAKYTNGLTILAPNQYSGFMELQELEIQ